MILIRKVDDANQNPQWTGPLQESNDCRSESQQIRTLHFTGSIASHIIKNDYSTSQNTVSTKRRHTLSHLHEKQTEVF